MVHSTHSSSMACTIQVHIMPHQAYLVRHKVFGCLESLHQKSTSDHGSCLEDVNTSYNFSCTG